LHYVTSYRHVAHSLQWPGAAGKAVLFMNMLLLLWTLVGGFLVNSNSIPVWLAWLRYVSPLSYAFEALMISEFRGTTWNFAVRNKLSVREPHHDDGLSASPAAACPSCCFNRNVLCGNCAQFSCMIGASNLSQLRL
jgi:ABC-2 type transporter